MAPDDVDMIANMRLASQRFNPFWFCRMVQRTGPWDFRMRHEDYRAFGNFHYGATAKAMGFSDTLILRSAGFEHWWSGRSEPEWGKPWSGWSYGDDPDDSLAILFGIAQAQTAGFMQSIYSRFLWRVFDIVVALCILAVTWPLTVVLAALVVLTDGRPAFDGSWRLGRFGKPFRCWKLRTLFVDHPRILQEYLAANPEARGQWEQYAKLPNDPRATWFGWWLRKTSLDDLLPQAWNILKGDMAVFGPRPFLVTEGERLGDDYESILHVTPGWVSYYGAYGRSRMPFAERVHLEAKYAKEMDAWRVKWAALKGTIRHCLRGTGA